jgi:hypothetical protein
MVTFVLRLWTPATEGPETGRARELRGIVEHVQLAESSSFRGDAELLRLLRAGLATSAPQGDRGSDPPGKAKPS